MPPPLPPSPSRRRFLARALAVPVGGMLCSILGGALPSRAAAAPLQPRPMLAVDAPAGIHPAGWLVSEKFDGVRALWDGRRLRFRSGREIAAPAWFLARLPTEPLDGELWLARRRFDALAGAVRKAAPVDVEWHALRYLVFDLPLAGGPFAERHERLRRLAAGSDALAWSAVDQHRVTDRAALQRRLDEVLRAGGEGLMLHRADAPYTAGRSAALLKLKAVADEDAVVLGHVEGRGRHAGRLGALRVRTAEGREFLLGTGFSDAERDAPPPPGATVTYRYRGRTASGVPRFASFVRVRELP
jgi:DNA ligase 1